MDLSFPVIRAGFISPPRRFLRGLFWLSVACFGFSILGFGLLGFGSEIFGAESPSVAAPEHELLEEVLREGNVQTAIGRPKVIHYLGDVSAALAVLIADFLSTYGDVDELLATVIRWLLIGAATVLVLMICWRLIKTLERREPDIVVSLDVEELSTGPVAEIDWLEELNSRLEAGEAAAALEALWWWLAHRLGQTDAEASWTTRELTVRAGRRDLLPAVRRFDRLTYSGEAFGVREVSRLRDGLQALLSSGAAS